MKIVLIRELSDTARSGYLVDAVISIDNAAAFWCSKGHLWIANPGDYELTDQTHTADLGHKLIVNTISDLLGNNIDKVEIKFK